MTVKQLIDKLQRNFAPEQEVFFAEPTTTRTAHAVSIRSATEDPIGHGRDGAGNQLRIVGGLGPESCVLWGSRKG